MVLNTTMASNPLNELKRRLDDDTTPLPKRLRLAKNVIHSDHFPAAPKERIVAEWLESITERNGLASKDIRHVISWLQFADELTNDLKCRLIKVVSHYLHSNPLNNEDIHFIINFLENDKISLSLQNQIDDYLFIIITLLQNLRNEVGKNILIQKLFTNLCKYYKECKKKLKFIVKFLDGENLETIFSYLDSDYRNAVLNVCQNILFPITKKTFFVNFLQHIIKNDNIDNFIADKSENVQSVIKILSAFFMFPKGRTGKDQKFLIDFVDTFVTCYRNEGQILFAFYIMAISSLNIRQNYLNPEMIIPSITFKENDDKIKRNIFFKMLITLLENEVDISIKLTYTIGEKNKVEMKKNFMSFLQATMLGCLKLEHKTDKISLQIIKAAIKLDPSLIEQKLDVILPPIMTAKKSSNAKEAYIEMFNCLVETLYKLSRGTVFIEKILPNIKLKLEALNVEQFELRQKLKDATDDVEKIKNKIITGEDILPQECVEMYGKLTSELMFRQNSGLLTSLQKDLEENCLMMLEEGFVSPSIIILTEVLSAILSSFFKYSKMADHTVPQQIAEEFWSSFQTFGKECLKKFGECILKLNYNSPLLLSFLKLCLSYSQLKLLNLKYGNIKMEETIDTTDMTDCSIVLPCFNGNQWMTLAQMIQEDESVIWDNLLLVKLMYSQVLKLKNSVMENETDITKAHVIKHLSEYSEVLTSDSYITRELFTNLDITQAKQIAKSLVKLFLNGNNCDIFKNVAISNNRILLNGIILETCKCIMKCFDNSNTITKAMNKSSFDIESFLQNVNVKEYFNELKIIENEEETIIKHVDSLKELPIYNLEENFRLTAIFVLLAIKKCCQTKKLRKSIDNILLSSYELSPKYPDLYKIFPVDFVFSFQDSTILNLLKLSLKTSNNMLIIKFILELTVKKVKTNSEILKELVEILLSKQYSNDSTQTIEYFSNTVFQIQCIILPIIAKEKRAITSSAFRTILANLQEKLHQAMLESFMHIDFTKIDNFNETDNIDDSLVTSDRGVATLNAIGAYSLTLLKYCEMTDVEELKKLDCLWSGLEFFVQNAIKAIENPNSKYQHIESSIQLLNIALRYIKKLESHKIFERKDDLFKLIWQSIKSRLLIIFDNSSKKRINTFLLEIIAVNIKFLAELSSVDCFVTQFLGDISNLANLKKPTLILKDEAMTNLQLTSHQTSKYLLQHCLKANLIGNKCVGVTKQIYQICKNLKHWIQIYFENDVHIDKQDRRNNIEMNDDSEVNLTDVKIDDAICNLLRIDLDMLSEVILAAKKTTLDYKFIDMIFELQHLIQYILGRNTLHTRCQITWQSFFILHEGSVTVLNNLLLSREELLEDRWPCFMQCYKVLIQCFCERVKSLEQSDRSLEQKLAETAHSIEKLTQSICKRKAHVSRIAAYAVADICIWIEKNGPPKLVRQHLENSIALLIQASDSTYAMAFLRRSLAGSVGQMTMSNMYSMYKRYHKYVGNS